jgi:arginase
VVKAVSEKLGGHVDILHLDKYPDVYDCFEGKIYSHASSFVSRRLLQVIVLLHLRVSSKISIIIY